jgi:hypothetical protein
MEGRRERTDGDSLESRAAQDCVNVWGELAYHTGAIDRQPILFKSHWVEEEISYR